MNAKIDKSKLNNALNKMIHGDLKKELDMADDNQKKVEDANQKIADARPGNVVSQISSFGTPSTYEDENHPEGKAIAQLDEERTQDIDKYNDDKESSEKQAEKAADEAVENAEIQVKQAEVEAKASDSKDSK